MTEAASQDGAAGRPSARTGGQLIVDGLAVHGVDRVYCVPGESYLDVLDALHDRRPIDLVVCKHEGAAANMAEADGKLTGRPGICIVTRGPGATHASIGVHIAAQDSTPMILFVGQIDTRIQRPRSLPGGGLPRRCSARWPNGWPRSTIPPGFRNWWRAPIRSRRQDGPGRSCCPCPRICWTQRPSAPTRQRTAPSAAAPQAADAARAGRHAGRGRAPAGHRRWSEAGLEADADNFDQLRARLRFAGSLCPSAGRMCSTIGTRTMSAI